MEKSSSWTVPTKCLKNICGSLRVAGKWLASLINTSPSATYLSLCYTSGPKWVTLITHILVWASVHWINIYVKVCMNQWAPRILRLWSTTNIYCSISSVSFKVLIFICLILLLLNPSLLQELTGLINQHAEMISSN